MNSWSRFVCTSVLATITLAPWSQADAALNAYLKLRGQKQGVIQGRVARKGLEGSIPVIAVSHEIVAARDAASGLATGKRTHKPLVLTMELDRSTPLIYKAMVTGEVLPEVELVVFAPADKLGKTPLYTVKLTNAAISEIRFVTAKDGPEAHEISLTYQKITWTWIDGGVAAEDDWETPVAKSQPAPRPMPMPTR